MKILRIACRYLVFLATLALLQTAATAYAQCTAAVGVNQSFSSALDSSCTSAHRSGRYAKYFTFTLSSSSTVTVNMTSGTFDTFLYLLSGSGSSGTVITFNDDYSGTNSRVSQTLAAGTYTLEATSYSSGATGAFALQIAASSSGGGGTSCQSNVSSNSSSSSALDSSCTSAHRSLRYARYFTFTLSSSSTVTVNMTSGTFDTFLYLLSGSGSSGTVITSNDDYSGTNSRVSETLAAGTYTLEATSYSSGATGSFVLQIASASSGGGGASCQSNVSSNSSSSSSLDSSCTSAHRSGRYARYFTFNLSTSSTVTVDMTSATFDTFLFLLSGSGTTGTVIAFNDDYSGSNARVSQTLAAGTYTLEATSYSGGATGSFALQIASSSGGGGGASCQSNVAANQSLSSALDSSCTSAHRSGRYARYFTFTLPSSSTVTVDMTSGTFDTYLYLLGGSDTTGTVIASNDDYSGTNARVSQTLAAGTYTIETTSYVSGATGSFGLQIASSSGAGGGTSCQAIVGTNQSLSSSLESTCTSVHRSGRYAKYFTFTLSASSSVTVDMTSPAFDTYLYLLGGSGTTGSVIDYNDDYSGSNARLSRTLAAGTYTLEATSYSSSATGPFGLSISAGSGEVTAVFLVHGINQDPTDLNSFATNLRGSSGLASSRFTIDNTFDFACSRDRNCSADCTISEAARQLGTHIATAAPHATRVVLVGYSMGGLVSRDLAFNSYSQFFSTRELRVLVTLGTPNAGYPYCEMDHDTWIFGKCGTLSAQMASQWRLHQDQNQVILSTYLYGLDVGWGSSSFAGKPRHWLAIAGTYCSADAVRICEWNSVDNTANNGCADASPASDGVVCESSALFRLALENLPDETYSDSSFKHSDNSLPDLCSDPGGLSRLFDPPVNSVIFSRIVEAINAN